MKLLEIIVPLVLIVILLACMMNKEDNGFELEASSFGVKKEAFSVGARICNKSTAKDDNAFTVGCSACQKGEGFNVGGQSDKTCNVTMIWADWCGYSNKAKPEWDKLVGEMQGQRVNGYTLNLSDAEEKIDPETVKKYSPSGFPSYFVELNDVPDKQEDFNSIEKEDMLDKIKKSINKLIGGSVSDAPPQPAPQVPVAPPQPAPQVPVAPPQLAPQVPVVPLVPTKVGKPVVPGEIYYKDCNEAYGPISLQSVSYNLLNSGAAQNVTGGVDCTDLDYAPIKTALGGPQIPHMGNIPGLGQLKAPDLGAVQGTIRPDSLQKVQPDADKKANVTMIWADWCGYSNKAKPEWNKLVSDMNDNSINGCKLNMRDLEHKRDEQEIKEKYSDVDGFPTYVVEVTDSSGKLIDKQNFNSIERNDMQQKLEAILNGI